MLTEKYKAALYYRISKEDGDKEESYSISNQRDLVLDYLKDHPEIVSYNEFIDEHVIIGTSGENLVKSRVSALVPFQFFCKGKYSFI